MAKLHRQGYRAALWLCALLGSLAVARADAGDTAQADALFARGRERLAAADYAEACPLLAESYRLDAATGSLLALALCREREGKLASAVAAYREVLSRSEAEGRVDRAAAARDKLAALDGKLSTLTIDAGAAQGEEALEVRLNGALIAPEQLGQPMPLDGGVARVDVASAGKVPWQISVSLASSGESLAVRVPPLVALPLPEPTPRAQESVRPAQVAAHAASLTRATRSDAPVSARSRAEWAGIATLGAGGVVLVTSVGLLLRAIHQEDRAQLECANDVCSSVGSDALATARRARAAATITALSGVGISVAGLITYIWGHRNRPSKYGTRAAAAPWLAPSALGGAVHGSF